MKMLRAAVSAALFTLIGASWALAQDVTLTSRDGSMEISGYLIGFDGEFYRIDTNYGVLTVDGSGVNCEGPGCPNLTSYTADIVISGAEAPGSVLMPALLEAFGLAEGYAVTREELPGVGLLYTLYEVDGTTPAARFTLRLATSQEGFADLITEAADLALSLREPTRQERLMARDAGLGDLFSVRQSRVVALDALVPIVNPDNPVRRLDLEAVSHLYEGTFDRWSDVGGEDAPVTLYLRDPNAGYGMVFDRTVVKAQGRTLSERVLTKASNDGVTLAVEDDPFGIGIASMSAQGMTEAITLTGDCAFEVSASQLSVKAGDYPLAAPVFLYQPAIRLPKIGRDFLRYLRTESAQRVVQRVGLVDQGISEVPLAVQGTRLANAIAQAGPEVSLEELQRLVALMTDSQRLTLTYRFEGGSTALDGPSRSNVGLLADALETGMFEGRSLIFVGFSDGQGDASLNRRLAQRRAEAVQAAVLQTAETFDRDRTEISVDAFGEALPMACDDTDWGRRINRRVEVWVR
ncbi:phosphate ABC transporter substrate-binding/OmpA family protein [Maritimibacter sp. DP1N21-5]|uniref:phosphate ABC transporter substrate-binding/OmpA family protein n=1 Tax=Maritimibacter sp. DP1N21-5 TaxID=2836867 RepID=UPI001C45316E|nr:phosphate ABC transporter substrate-binding/OmpA family protein [Maritimibacter sp. DP1N21-5]MBV7411030.1 substrate-binding domain-containing protein [Maritimibacter sp. DP1N21-5]